MSAKKRLKILVVDDESGIRDLLSEILTDEGYAVATAHDAESAWKIRNEELPELILLDIWMPGLDGISLLKQWLHAGFAKVPVIIMSGHATIDTAVEAMRLGAVEVLEKPIAMDKLLTSVEKALAQRRETDTNPMLQQVSFGQSLVMQSLKTALLNISARTSVVTMVGPPNSGAIFFAQFLAKAKSQPLFIDSGDQLEGDIDDFLNRVADGIIIVRLMDALTVAQQDGLLGLLREAGRVQVRVIVCVTHTPSLLSEKFDFNDILVSMLSRHVVTIPALPDYKADLPAIIQTICRQLMMGTDRPNRTLSPAAVNALANRDYEDDFAELLSIIRSALFYTDSDEVHAATVQSIANHFSQFSPLRRIREKMYDLPLREARDTFEREYFTQLISATHGNLQQAAKIAGLDRSYVYRRLRQYEKEDKKTSKRS